jgi:hypothetical protein
MKTMAQSQSRLPTLAFMTRKKNRLQLSLGFLGGTTN